MSGRKRNVPTMADVARATGLSPTTISFVINNAPAANIPNETRERVWEVIRELGYRPNAAARMLRTQRSHTIGISQMRSQPLHMRVNSFAGHKMQPGIRIVSC